MNIPFVDLHAQYLSIKSEIDHAISSVIAESAFIRSKYVTDFEKEFATAVGVKHCVSCANGTDAIYILMRGLGIKPGDEVITSAHSWISTSETITQAGGKVVFCDTKSATCHNCVPDGIGYTLVKFIIFIKIKIKIKIIHHERTHGTTVVYRTYWFKFPIYFV